MSEKAEKDPEYLTTLERGLTVLRAFDENRPEMRLSEVAAATGLSPAVARRCLNTLVALGYVAQHERMFLLRPEVLAFGSAFLSSMHLEDVCLPPLQALRDETGDSASLAALVGHNIVYLAHVSTNRRIRLRVNVGSRFPAHATSMGKAILAFLPDPAVEAFLATAPFEKFTEHTVTTAEGMRPRLRRVREKGYDSALDELDFGIVSVAVPVFDANRKPIAAINCSTSTTRISQGDLIETRLPRLREAAAEIESALRRWPALAHALQEQQS